MMEWTKSIIQKYFIPFLNVETLPTYALVFLNVRDKPRKQFVVQVSVLYTK